MKFSRNTIIFVQFYILKTVESMVIVSSKEFFSIPVEHRCNPFDISPSGDLFWADKRNIELVKEGERQIKEGKFTRISTPVELDKFLDSL